MLFKKNVHFKFINISFYEIVRDNKWGYDAADIIDWYPVKESEKFMNVNGSKMVGLKLVKSSMNTVIVICESIEIEETPLKEI